MVEWYAGIVSAKQPPFGALEVKPFLFPAHQGNEVKVDEFELTVLT